MLEDELWMRQREKPPRNRGYRFFENRTAETEFSVFEFWGRFGLVFRKPISEIFIRFRTPPLETNLQLYNVCILLIFLYGSEVWSVTSTLLKKTTMRSGLALNNRSCPTVFIDDVCLSSAISVEPTSVKTIPELFRPAFWVLQRTGDVESVDSDKPGWGRSRTICARSILARQQQGGTQWTDRHSNY